MLLIFFYFMKFNFKEMSNDAINYWKQHAQKELEYYKERHIRTKVLQDASYYMRFIECYQNIIGDIEEYLYTN